MAVAELARVKTERGDQAPPIWCNKKNVRDLLKTPQYGPAILDCDLVGIPDFVREDLGVQPQIDQRKQFQIFRDDIEEGLEEAKTLRFDYKSDVPVEKVNSTTPGAELYKVRTPWPATISEWPSIDVGWAWANYVNPDLNELSAAFSAYVKTPEFASRYIKGDIIGNRKRAENLIERGDQLLDEYLRSFKIMLRVPKQRFNQIISPHYSHFLEHFYLDRSEYVQDKMTTLDPTEYMQLKQHIAA